MPPFLKRTVYQYIVAHQSESPPHAGVLRLVSDLARLYRTEPALHEFDCRHEGFWWVDCSDNHSSTLTFVRQGQSP